ncbi:RES family NAD+ phosphorylase [Brevundimonas sp. TSRC1-1]|uniref:RES family NAD+ phosphorylase n=1 Tax=Brevundimonas sp. TSRC1-1 TaxID=2804562 RepID=UPI003CF5B00A
MDDDELSEKRLCIACVDEPFLAGQMMKDGETAVCDYCGKTEATETIAELADRFELLFEAHFERAAETSWDDQRGDEVAFIIQDTGRIDEAPANDIQQVMADRHEDMEAAQMGERTAYDSELSYVESDIDDRRFQEDWEALETDLKTRNRFFSDEVETVFGRLFADLHALKTRDGRPVIRAIGVGTDLPALYRARAFQSSAAFDEAIIDPERFVGTPAPRFARAGRMNPHGVPFFYGATTEQLALTEVRPPVGSRVITGRFELQATLQVLDVEALESVLERGSLFDPAFGDRLARAKFLGKLARRIRMPVLPDDELTDYLVTQVMAGYLASRISPSVHGVAYGSAQGEPEAFNVALFNGSSRVRPAAALSGARHEVRASGNEDEIDAWVVSTTIKAPPPSPPPAAPVQFILEPPDPETLDLRAEVLVLDRDSMKVHHVHTVCVKADALPIYRFSHTDGDPEPF